LSYAWELKYADEPGLHGSFWTRSDEVVHDELRLIALVRL
jgi:hypothetical protein